MPDDARTIIFLHIPKTAGATLRTVLERQFRPDEVYSQRARADVGRRHVDAIERGTRPETWGIARVTDEVRRGEVARLPLERRERLRLVSGHFWFGVHEALPGPSTYVTVLRDPIERVLSLYAYRVASQGLTVGVDEYLERGTDVELRDGQTRLLSRTPDPIGLDDSTDEMLSSAKRNLSEHFALVGLTERFDETVALLGERFGWTRLRYVPRNVSADRPRAEELSDRALRRIRELNARDTELYAFAAELFERRVDASGEALRDRVAQLRRRNRIYQAWPLAARAWERARARIR